MNEMTLKLASKNKAHSNIHIRQYQKHLHGTSANERKVVEIDQAIKTSTLNS
jgi:hypothetical protein